MSELTPNICFILLLYLNEGMSLRFNQLQHLDTLSRKYIYTDKKEERIMQIQQKLSAISTYKSIHEKDQIQINISKRVIELQAFCCQKMKMMERQKLKMKEILSDARVKEAQILKKCELVRKKRQNQMAQLKKYLSSLLIYEQEAAKSQGEVVANIFEHDLEEMSSQMQSIKHTRIVSIKTLQQSVEKLLPNLNFIVQLSNNHCEQMLESCHQFALTSANQMKETIKRMGRQREQRSNAIMEMIDSAIDNIKEDLQQERKDRFGTKERLITLFEIACGKINFVQ